MKGRQTKIPDRKTERKKNNIQIKNSIPEEKKER